MTRLSIIIPTLNEEQQIGQLLQSLARQTFTDFEIVIVDGNSNDHTKGAIDAFSEKLNIKFIVEPKRGIGRARNVGAANAAGDYLLFLDADVITAKTFLESAIKEFDERYLDIATCYVTPISDKLLDVVLHEAANAAIKTSQYFSPAAPGYCIFITKRLHNRIRGFNEQLTLGEDHDYGERASQLGKFRVLKNSRVKVSVRRLDKDGRAKLVAKYIYGEIYRRFVGDVTKPLFKYEFGQHEPENKDGNKQSILRFGFEKFKNTIGKFKL
ncbi:MAG: glycosyltransferase [DPANN group archaeon]|nr:glycosyltransferase [DPANN group archaeon]